jgi:hypothetical protein
LGKLALTPIDVIVDIVYITLAGSIETGETEIMIPGQQESNHFGRYFDF